MLTLNEDQTAALEAWAEQRYRDRLAVHFTAAWPAAVARLGDRLAEFIDVGIGRARRHGMTQGRDIARYLNLCFVWGAGFEERPGFEWARALVEDARRGGSARARQLMLGSREQIQRAGNARGLAAFDAAEERLRRELADLTVPSQWWSPGFVQPWVDSPCDIDALLFWVENLSRPEYRYQDGRWQSLPMAPVVPIRCQPGEPLPEAIALLAGPWRDGSPAHLGLRLRQAEVCDAARHPRVAMTMPDGRREWRGAAAMDLAWKLRADLQSEPGVTWPSEAGAASLPLAGAPIAFEGAARFGLLEIETCGLRDGVAPLGGGRLRVAVWAAPQHLLDWRLAPAARVQVDGEGTRLPESEEPGAALVPPDAWRARHGLPVVRVERDGQVLSPAGWSTGLAALNDAWIRALERLLQVWGGIEGMHSAWVAGRCDLLAGGVGLTWGRRADRLAGEAWLRVDGRFDLAGALALELGGELLLEGARARLRLVAGGGEPLRASLARAQSDHALSEMLAASCRRLRIPFAIEVAPLCGDGAGSLSGRAPANLPASMSGPSVPVTGALVGAYGLRARRDGQGWQWFATLALEPVSAVLALDDPLLGQTAVPRPLLPALDLLDWELG
ncbi:hypothetical protein [Derxia gummosa]|uniref:Uncharacterized protein n=1 Tax=Derxia gummosa DSM 723 TaxID=1121388 RepID=A0A8B6X2F9_9BURK|nr:hypothetical protein [Derxia gummosa]